MDLFGVVLAAGAGRRFGGPKALARAADGTTWITLATDALTEAGCSRIAVVLGAGAEQARELVPPRVDVVVATRWAEGMSASLAAGLAVMPADADAVLVTLVDLPGLPPEAARRVAADGGASVLRRAAVHGRPTHPVLIGRDHVGALAGSLSGDSGARDYLASHRALAVEVGDLWDGADVDTVAVAATPAPPAVRRGR